MNLLMESLSLKWKKVLTTRYYFDLKGDFTLEEIFINLFNIIIALIDNVKKYIQEFMTIIMLALYYLFLSSMLILFLLTFWVILG